MRRQYEFKSSFNRPNLHYKILPKTGKSLEEIAEYIKDKRQHQSGIIYCLSRKNCETTSDKLKQLIPEMRNKVSHFKKSHFALFGFCLNLIATGFSHD